MEAVTTNHSAMARLAKPLNGVFSCIARGTSHFFEAKVHDIRLAQLNKLLSGLDPHILKDIGLEGFDRLTPTQKLRALKEQGKRMPGINGN